MVLRLLMRYLANNEQLIQRMADSYPMRRAAQMVVSLMYRTKSLAREQGLHEMTPERFKWVSKCINKIIELTNSCQIAGPSSTCSRTMCGKNWRESRRSLATRKRTRNQLVTWSTTAIVYTRQDKF